MTNLADYQISDRYTKPDGQVFVTGVQALARIPVQQLLADRAAGLNTAAFVSGYQGSPLGGLDKEVVQAAKLVPHLPIVFRPGVNEELGATAVMGSQLASEQPDCKYDGILGLWYGKAPGLDRAGDALRHAVFAGTSHHGGAVAIIGDDPSAKSSSLPSSSDATLVDLHMPILYPGDVQEVLDLGRHAVALSRAAGVWTSLKIVAAVADGSGTVQLNSPDSLPSVRTVTLDGKPYVHHPSGKLLTPYTLDLEREFREVRSELVLRYAVENKLNHLTANPSDAWMGIVSSGYTYHEVLEALRRLGLRNLDEIEAAGIRLLHMTMPVPFDRANMRNFAKGLDEIIVVEEKNPTLEWLVKDALYGGPDQPLVVGKQHPDGRTLMQSYGLLDADKILPGLRERLDTRIGDRLTPPPRPERTKTLIPLAVERKPYFCSGCPHNWGIKSPEGSLVGAGIGCHTMVMLMDEDKSGNVAGLTSMGAEGSQWIGMAPFIERDHLFQNLGDGTFFHSGQLAIQATIAANVNITYKLLYNATVAMTGAQDIVGGVEVPEIATILFAHGVKDILITTDDVGAYKGIKLPTGPNGRVQVWDRTRIIEAQEHLATIEGVTVLINDQACAAQARRLRKRGKVATPTERVVINHRICEACGDCGEVSNCLSVQPVETPFGRKTTIDQNSCNLDFSCVQGDCPSFMTVEMGDRASAEPTIPPTASISTPRLRVPEDEVSLRLAGIGGTGVVTVSQVLSTAAMLDGWHVRGLDQIGLSQKAGPVVSDICLSRTTSPVSNLIGLGEADAVLAFDLLVGADNRTLSVASVDKTTFVGSTTTTPTGSMIGKPEMDYPELAELMDRVETSTRGGSIFVDGGALVESLLGDRAAANVFMLGVGVQAGILPMTPASMERAIELNGVAVAANLAAFNWGRRWVDDPASVDAAAAVTPATAPAMPANLTELVDMLAADLVEYQDEAYAKDFRSVVDQAVAAQRRCDATDDQLAIAVAKGLHKLLAYKDEYEVARLLLLPESRQAAEAIGGAGAAITWKLDPPMLKALPKKFRPKHAGKIGVSTTTGIPAMKALTKMKRLRGSRLDPFGRAEVRQVERALIEEYQAALASVLPHTNTENLGEVVDLAKLAMDVRGFEDIKLGRAATMRAQLAAAVQALESA